MPEHLLDRKNSARTRPRYMSPLVIWLSVTWKKLHSITRTTTRTQKPPPILYSALVALHRALPQTSRIRSAAIEDRARLNCLKVGPAFADLAEVIRGKWKRSSSLTKCRVKNYTGKKRIRGEPRCAFRETHERKTASLSTFVDHTDYTYHRLLYISWTENFHWDSCV